MNQIAREEVWLQIVRTRPYMKYLQNRKGGLFMVINIDATFCLILRYELQL